jgi:hypothetical protein
MWISNTIVSDTKNVARIFYIDREAALRWNKYRRPNELRLMTGWCWVAKDGFSERVGIKSQTAAFIDAYYTLVLRTTRPSVRRGGKPPILRAVA